MRHFIPFLVYTIRSTEQAAASRGFLNGSLLRQPHHVHCTMTLWDSAESMRTFRNGGDHLKAMSRIGKWCDETAVTTREWSHPDLPSWPQAWQWLRENPTFTRLPYPSKSHQERQIPGIEPILSRGSLVPLTPGFGLGGFLTSNLFRLFNGFVLIPWAAMIFAPQAQFTQKLVSWNGWFIIGGALYSIFLILGLDRKGLPALINPTLPRLLILFRRPSIMTAGWLHFLAFDLFVGRFIYLEGLARGVWAAPFLLLTFFGGPVGLLAWIAWNSL